LTDWSKNITFAIEDRPKMMEFADVKNDVAFRKVFGNENRKDSLISFLNAVLDFKGKQKIASVEILNPYQLPKLRGGKVTIVDIQAKDQAGRSYIVEMQVGELDGFSKRVLFYFSKSYSEQIKRGDFYRKLKPVIFIGIVDYSFSKNPNYISRHQIRDVETHEHLLKDVEFNFIELPKFNKELHELENLTEKWIYFIKNAENLDVIPENVDDEGLKIAYQEANKHTWTEAELKAYDYAFMREEDERARLDKAKQKGLEQGLQKGLQEGLQKGEQLGLQKKQIEIAKKAINKGLDNQTISELTDLTSEQIERLRKEQE
jgi:predicted transposase/invertase (TIGR01784 family)